MTVGKALHVILGQEMLKPRDGAEKDEGELTGGKRLVEQLRKRHGHFADVIVADALYLNAPFINTIKENGLEAVKSYFKKNEVQNKTYGGIYSYGITKKRKKINKEIRKSYYSYYILSSWNFNIFC